MPIDQLSTSKTSVEPSGDQLEEYLQRENMPSCMHCNTYFSSPYGLERHVNEWCPLIKPMKRKRMEDSDDEFDDVRIEENPGFQELWRNAKDENTIVRIDKIQKYEDHGLDHHEAKVKANQKFLDEDKKSFYKLFGDIFRFHLLFRQTDVYNQLELKVLDIVDKDNITVKDAIAKVLPRFHAKFDILMSTEPESDTDSESSADESNGEDSEENSEESGEEDDESGEEEDDLDSESDNTDEKQTKRLPFKWITWK